MHTGAPAPPSCSHAAAATRAGADALLEAKPLSVLTRVLARPFSLQFVYLKEAFCPSLEERVQVRTAGRSKGCRCCRSAPICTCLQLSK